MERTLASQTPQHIGEEVTLKGWVNAHRSHGPIVFIDLRDRSGLVQVVFTDNLGEQANTLKTEYVVEITGTVQSRNERYINDKLTSGTVEVWATTLTTLNTAQTPPFPIDSDGHDIDEDLRLKYRYLDLRRQR